MYFRGAAYLRDAVSKIVQTERNTKRNGVFLLFPRWSLSKRQSLKDSANRAKYKEKRSFFFYFRGEAYRHASCLVVFVMWQTETQKVKKHFVILTKPSSKENHKYSPTRLNINHLACNNLYFLLNKNYIIVLTNIT